MKYYSVRRALRRIFMKDSADEDGLSRQSRTRKDFSFSHNSGSVLAKNRLFKLRIKTAILSTVLVFCVIFLGYLLLFNPFFKIKSIHVTGLERINEKEFRTVIQGVLDKTFFFVLPGDSFFLVDIDELTDILQHRFALESIIVTKSFPHNILIEVGEKEPELLYDSGEYYSYVDRTGHVVEVLEKTAENEWHEIVEYVVTSTVLASDMSSSSIGENVNNIVRHSTSTSGTKKVLGITTSSSSSTISSAAHIRVPITRKVHTPNIDRVHNEFGEIPLIYDLRHIPVSVNTFVLDNALIDNALEFYTLLQNNSDIDLGYYIYASESGVAYTTFKTREGWDILLDLNRSVYDQFSSLMHVLEKETPDRTVLQQIDVRYKNRVYWY